MQCVRYGMAAVQVIMFMVMLVQSGYMEYLNMTGTLQLYATPDNTLEDDSAWRAPDNLVKVCLVSSSFVVGGAIFASAQLIYLIV